MQTIHKFEITPDGEPVRMPPYSEVLSAGVQSGKIFIWAEVDDSRMANVPRNFEVFGTGHEIPTGTSIMPKYRKFINTVFMGNLVFHVYERKQSQP